jgi:hypothetical protein
MGRAQEGRRVTQKLLLAPAQNVSLDWGSAAMMGVWVAFAAVPLDAIGSAVVRMPSS